MNLKNPFRPDLITAEEDALPIENYHNTQAIEQIRGAVEHDGSCLVSLDLAGRVRGFMVEDIAPHSQGDNLWWLQGMIDGDVPVLVLLAPPGEPGSLLWY